MNPKPPRPPPGYPKGYEPDPERPDVFDPALKHYSRAFIKGPPPLSGEEGARLKAARAKLLRKCMQAIGRSPVIDRVVVRGSVTLELWYGDRARPARDIDLVVVPASLRPDTAQTAELLWALNRAVSEVLRAEDPSFDCAEIAVDSIWTYDRAEGRRLTFPWLWDGRVRDLLQVDVVFCEPLLQPAELISVEGVPVRTASREESLAWKLLWITTDMWPQGKDLYDAVLLAEDVKLSADFLKRVFETKSATWRSAENLLDDVQAPDWANFAAEYPALAQGTCAELRARLERALARSLKT